MGIGASYAVRKRAARACCAGVVRARGLPFLSSSSGERSETGGPSGAEGEIRLPHRSRTPSPRQGPARAGRWVPRSAPRRRGLPEDDERRGSRSRVRVHEPERPGPLTQ